MDGRSSWAEVAQASRELEVVDAEPTGAGSVHMEGAVTPGTARNDPISVVGAKGEETVGATPRGNDRLLTPSQLIDGRVAWSELSIEPLQTVADLPGFLPVVSAEQQGPSHDLLQRRGLIRGTARPSPQGRGFHLAQCLPADAQTLGLETYGLASCQPAGSRATRRGVTSPAVS